MIKVKGKAVTIKSLKPLIKFFLLSSIIKEKVCLQYDNILSLNELLTIFKSKI